MSLPERAVHGARQVKHALFVGAKRTRWAGHDAWIATTSTAWREHAQRHPYVYDADRYRRSFLRWDAPTGRPAPEVPRRILTLWTGDAPLTPQRRRCLEDLRRIQRDLEVVLIRPEDVERWVVPGHPLHPAYADLSLVHRSDYLRAYLLHHHGGGYSDLKSPTAPWAPQLERFADPDLHLLGYPEVSTGWVAQLPGPIGRDLRRYYRCVPGGGAFAARAGSPLTAEWLAEVERRLDYYAPLLRRHPGGVRNEVPAYPIGWNRLLAQVLHPLALKHHAHVRLDGALRPSFVDYQ